MSRWGGGIVPGIEIEGDNWSRGVGSVRCFAAGDCRNGGSGNGDLARSDTRVDVHVGARWDLDDLDP